MSFQRYKSLECMSIREGEEVRTVTAQVVGN